MASHALALRMAKELRLNKDPALYEDLDWKDAMDLVEVYISLMQTPDSITIPAVAEFFSSNLPNYCLSVQHFPSHLAHQDPVEMCLSLLSRQQKDPSWARFCRTHEGAKKFFGFAVKCLAEEYDEVEKMLGPGNDSLITMGFSCRIDNLSEVAIRILALSDPSQLIQPFLSAIPPVAIPILRKYVRIQNLRPPPRQVNQYRGNLENAVRNASSLAALLDDPSKIKIIREICPPSVWEDCLGKGLGGCVPHEGKDELKACGKCFGVRFCGTDHQRATWAQHKKSCFASTW